MLTPSACVASAMYCACMSVGKPGYSSVEISAARSLPWARTRTASGPSTSTRAPASSQLGDHRAQMRGIAVGHDQVAAGNRARNQKRSRLNAIGTDAVTARRAACSRRARESSPCPRPQSSRPWQSAARPDRTTSGSRAQFSISGFAVGQHRGHEQIFSAGDGDLVEDQMCAAQAPRRRRPQCSRAPA